MSMMRLLYASALLVVSIASSVSAQSGPVQNGLNAPLNLTFVTEADRVRVTTPGTALVWRLEVIGAQGQPVFDSGVVTATELDWPLVDVQGNAVESGLYRYTLTIGGGGSEARLQRGELQIERVRSLYRISSLTTESTGDITLTATEGPVPSASASDLASPSTLPRSLGTATFGAPQPYISGSGTTGAITKWLDGPAGTVGDSNVTESNGNVLIGNGTYHGNLHIFGGATDDLFAGMGVNLVSGPAFNFGYAGASFGRSAGFFNVRPDASATPPNPSLRFMTGNQERMIINNIGDVGIGLSNPFRRLHVYGPESRLRLHTTSASNWAVTEYVTNAREWHTGVGGSNVSAVNGKYYIYDANNGQLRLTIDQDGDVNIGTSLSVGGTFENGGSRLAAGNCYSCLRALDPNGKFLFDVLSSGIYIGVFDGSTTTHVCRTYPWLNEGYLANCSSAAEYVPTAATPSGSPQTADLVSISPGDPNPYQDNHAPFVVRKTTTPCDENLLGFIVNPESGADGKRVNDQYLPLAIYGYFPAKVTTENGRIRRGDPITSSSTPGKGMKSTAACKIIGYALEDADTDETIQVFANLGRSAGPDMTARLDQLNTVTRENAELKQALSALEARLVALERARQDDGRVIVAPLELLQNGAGVGALLARLR